MGKLIKLETPEEILVCYCPICGCKEWLLEVNSTELKNTNNLIAIHCANCEFNNSFIEEGE